MINFCTYYLLVNCVYALFFGKIDMISCKLYVDTSLSYFHIYFGQNLL